MIVELSDSENPANAGGKKKPNTSSIADKKSKKLSQTKLVELEAIK